MISDEKYCIAIFEFWSGLKIQLSFDINVTVLKNKN